MQSRRAQSFALLGKQNAIRCKRKIANARIGREHSNKLRKIAPQQRLAPRESHVFDAQRGKHLNQPRDFLERQQFLPRQPDVLLLRHAVVAAQVAPVGH